MKNIRIFLPLILSLPVISQAQQWNIDKGGYFTSGTGAVISG